MLTLNGTKLLTERFPNNETKVKDFENAIVDGQNVLEFKYTTDEDLVTLMFVKKWSHTLEKQWNCWKEQLQFIL